jgi:hypothetical protein
VNVKDLIVSRKSQGKTETKKGKNKEAISQSRCEFKDIGGTSQILAQTRMRDDGY